MRYNNMVVDLSINPAMRQSLLLHYPPRYLRRRGT